VVFFVGLGLALFALHYYLAERAGGAAAAA